MFIKKLFFINRRDPAKCYQILISNFFFFRMSCKFNGVLDFVMSGSNFCSCLTNLNNLVIQYTAKKGKEKKKKIAL